MLGTKHNEVLAAFYSSNIAQLRPHSFCSSFHSIKVKECHKKRGYDQFNICVLRK